MPAPLLSTSQAAYLLSGLTDGSAPQRADLRPLQAYRSIHLQTGVVPTANASARVGLAGTEITVGVSCQVDVDGSSSAGPSSGRSRGGVECSVQFSNALVHSSLPAGTASLDDLSNSLTSLLSALGSSVLSSDLQITPAPHARYWVLHLDAFVGALAGGNSEDALLLAANAALRALRIPRTRAVSYEAGAGAAGVPHKGKDAAGGASGAAGSTEQLGTGSILSGAIGAESEKRNAARRAQKASDFELLDSTPDAGGRALSNAEDLPVCVSAYLLPNAAALAAARSAKAAASGTSAPPASLDPRAYLLDPTPEEQHVLPARVHVLADRRGRVHGVLHSAGASAESDASGAAAPDASLAHLSPIGTDQATLHAALRAGAMHAKALAELVGTQLTQQGSV